jgi:hypothetical protein
MRTPIALAATVLALSLIACGGDDETTSTAGAALGAAGGQGPVTGAAMTASEFIQASIPDQIQAVQEAAARDAGCEGKNTDAGSDLQVAVAIDAARSDPKTPLSDVVADAC